MAEHDPTLSDVARWLFQAFYGHPSEPAPAMSAEQVQSELFFLGGELQALRKMRPCERDALVYAREQGRREVYAEIAKLHNDRSGQYEGYCFFCDAVYDQCEPSCLWRRAKAAVGVESAAKGES